MPHWRDFFAWYQRDLATALTANLKPAPPADQWLLALIAVSAVAALLLFLSGGHHSGFVSLNALAQQLPPWLWQMLTLLGDGRLLFALALLFARQAPHLLWSLVLAALLVGVYSFGIKHALNLPRPPAVLNADQFVLIGPGHRSASFPSGHSASAALFFGVLICYFKSVGWRLLWLALAVSVGMSRIALGVHWPLDVAAGFVGGFGAAWIGVRLMAQRTTLLTQVRLHLVMISIAAVLALVLIIDDGGYHDIALMQTMVGVVLISWGLWVYLLRPWWRWSSRLDS